MRCAGQPVSGRSGPLAGYTVLDATRVRAGPTAVHFFADLGAGDQDRDPGRCARHRRHDRRVADAADSENLHRNKVSLVPASDGLLWRMCGEVARAVSGGGLCRLCSVEGISEAQAAMQPGRLRSSPHPSAVGGIDPAGPRKNMRSRSPVAQLPHGRL